MSTIRSTAPDGGMTLMTTREGSAGAMFVWWIILAAWSTVVFVHLTGWDELLGHDELLTGDSPLWLTLVLFLAGWQMMVAAMMLPSSMPGFQVFAAAIPPEAHRRRLLASFLIGHSLAWTAFGIAVLLGDGVVHAIVEDWTWLAARPGFIGGSALVLAGGFELCRTPGEWRHSATARSWSHNHLRPTVATRMGAAYGLQRLRHCGPLMLLSFAAGMTSLAWMVALTIIMALPHGHAIPRRVTAAHAGAGLLALGTLVLLNPVWLPPLFPGTP